MGDPEDLVELSVYAILVGLALPFVKTLEKYSPAFAVGFLVLAIAPLPIWIVGFRLGRPDWLTRILVWNCWLVLAMIGVMLIGLAVMKIAA